LRKTPRLALFISGVACAAAAAPLQGRAAAADAAQPLARTVLRKLAIVLPVCCLIAGCGSGSDEAATDMPPQGYQPFDVVGLHPEAGDGDLTGVGGARVLADRSIQILVEGGRANCRRSWTRKRVQRQSR